MICFPLRASTRRSDCAVNCSTVIWKKESMAANLWPGYCLFTRGVDDDALLDFRQDWFVGLDTGGMNAGLLATKRAGRKMTFAKRRSIGHQRNFATTADEIDWFDDCVHLGNASGWLHSNTEREPALDRLLESIVDGELKPPPEHRIVP